MHADDLQHGFRLGEWSVAPGAMQLVGPLGTRALRPAHVQLLLALAASHGEAVEKSELALASGCSEESLDEQLLDLARTLGDTPEHRRYIVPVGHDACALIAHFEPQGRPSAPSTSPSTSAAGAGVTTSSTELASGGLHWVLAELRRRHVIPVCGAYLVGAWITLQVAQLTFAPLHLPGWWMTALTIVAVIGLPIVAILAWSYEITPAGIEFDAAATGIAHMQLPRARRAVAPVLVAGVALLAGITGFAWWRSIETADDESSPIAPVTVAEGVPSIAVLPLVDLSPGGGYAYLGEGLSEELSVRLAQVEGLRVAARTSAFRFRDRAEDVRRIGQLLGVGHVLEGSVRREGGKLRVAVQLIDARTGFHAWAENYDRPWRDVLAIQDEIAKKVTQALEVVLTPAASQPGGIATNLDLGAFDAYLAGLALLRQSGDAGALKEAAARFEQALEVEPGFARAHAGLCEVGVRRHQLTRDPGDLNRAEQHCIRALELDDSLLETEKALASLYVAGGRYAAAKVTYEQLLLRHPGDADGAIGLARALQGQGDKAGAERNFRRAIEMEPGFWGGYKALGAFLFAQGRLSEAIEAYQHVVELTPSSASAHNNLGAVLQMQGSQAEAVKSFERSLRFEPSRSAYSNLGSSYYYLGQFERAAEMYAKATALAAQDQSLWGNLADALWQIPSRRERAIATYRRAVALAERDLAQTPGDALLLAQLAFYYAQTGQPERSLQSAQKALEADAKEPYVRYYTALAAIGRGELAQAVAEIEAAVVAGYPTSSLATAPELAGIRDERGFVALLARAAESPRVGK